MIKLLLFCCIIFPAMLSAQTDNDTIIWSAKPLTWDNFKGNYDTAVYNRQHLATTLWKLQYQYKPELSKNRIVFIIYTWFDTKKSWVRKKSRQSNSLLLHEQGHFDLAEIFARHFRKKIASINFNLSSYKDSINNNFNKQLDKAYAQQILYDKETNYGTNEEVQKKWQLIILNGLKETDMYKNINVETKLSN